MTDDGPVGLGIDLGSTACRAAWRQGKTRGGSVNAGNGRHASWLLQLRDPAGIGARFVGIKDCLDDPQQIESPAGVCTTSELLASFLQETCQQVERSAGRSPEAAMVVVPSLYPERAQQVIRDLLAAAGIERVHFVEDCVAAVLGITGDAAEGQTVLVYNCGYRGLELGLARAMKGRCRVLGIQQSPVLAGHGIDLLLMQACRAALKQRLDFSLATRYFAPRDWLQFRARAEQIKEALSRGGSVEWVLGPELTGRSEAIHATLHASQFAARLLPAIRETVELASQLLGQHGLAPDGIDALLLAGGTTRLAGLSAELEGWLGRPPQHAAADLLAGAAARLALQAIEQGETGRATTQVDGDSLDPRLAPLPEADDGLGRLLSIEDRAQSASPERPDTAGILRYAADLAASGRTDRARAFASSLVEELQEFLGTLPAEQPGTELQRTLDLAWSALAAHELEAAIGYSHAAHRLAPREPGVLDAVLEIHRKAALALDRPEQFDLSIEWMLCALAHDQSNIEVRQATAERYYRQARVLHDGGDLPGAIDLLEHALGYNPHHPEGRDLFLALKRR